MTKLRVTPSASASSPADRYLHSSSNRFQRCARASARISVSSGRGFVGAQALPPSGAMIHLASAAALPGYRRADGNRRAIELPVLAGTFRPVFTPPSPPVTEFPRPAPAAPRPAAARACHRRQGRSAQPAAARSAPSRPETVRPRMVDSSSVRTLATEPDQSRGGSIIAAVNLRAAAGVLAQARRELRANPAPWTRRGQLEADRPKRQRPVGELPGEQDVPRRRGARRAQR